MMDCYAQNSQHRKPARHANPTIKAQRLAYLIWERQDIDKSAALSQDLRA